MSFLSLDCKLLESRGWRSFAHLCIPSPSPDIWDTLVLQSGSRSIDSGSSGFRYLGLLLLLSRSVMSDILLPHGLQRARLPCPSPSPGVCSNSCPLSWWCHLAISSSVAPFPSCPQSFPASGSFPVSRFFHIRWPKYWEFQLQHQSFQWTFRIDLLLDGLLWSPCCPRDSQEFSPTPQFKSMNSLVLSLLYGPAFTSVQNYNMAHQSHYWEYPLRKP